MYQKVCKKCGSWIIKIPTLESSTLCHICYPLNNLEQRLIDNLREKNMSECYEEKPFKDLKCFEEISSVMDEIARGKSNKENEDSLLEKSNNLYLKISKYKEDIIKFFTMTYFAVKINDIDESFLKHFIEGSLIEISSIPLEEEPGFKLLVNFVPKHRVHLYPSRNELKKLSDEIDSLELEKTKICRQGQIQQAKNEIVRQQKYLHGLEQEYLVLKQEYEKLIASS